MLELRGISAGYDTGVVLHSIDLTVPDGAVVALLGPNGAGKTTALRVASGVLHPNSGDVILDDDIVTGQASDRLARKGVCHVPEGRGIFRALSVADNVRLQASAADRQAITKVASVFPRLGERRKQLAGTLSGGEQQMLSLAHAYLCEPKVVLLDEISMGLAPRVIDEIFAFLRVLADRGTSLLLVEQYVKRALDLADYVYIMNRGRICFVGEPWEVGDDTAIAAYLGELAAS